MRRFSSILSALLLPMMLTACEARDLDTTASPPQTNDSSVREVAGQPLTLPRITMHKDPNCGCCSLWARHVEEAGFPVTEVANRDMNAIKQTLGVPAGKGSCHTAEVEGYFIEGHVPVEDIRRLLAERPEARGLAAPGMPIGSPGMPGPPEPYTVFLIGKDGSSAPYSQHGR